MKKAAFMFFTLLAVMSFAINSSFAGDPPARRNSR